MMTWPTDHSATTSMSTTDAVIDLPMYLVVSIVIGIIALGSILSMMVIPSFFSETPIVTIEPLVTTVNASNSSITYYVQVNTLDHQPIRNAHVIIKESNTIAVNTTNSSGETRVNIRPMIPAGLHEVYLDVIVKTNRYESFTNTDLLKVILRR
ncbi:MAG: hypothetical protein KGY65_05655 [Candidatus Thermoplasmatota archaeon]|nr:hypothetical protein [Candidatus Thermoplasmatota archaeon]MBS3802217.1 hypothetical protein [Candidatus Thermoplasmatota archaeon]